MSENSDAVVVVVSEETGSVSVAIGGMLKRHLAPETLEKLLRNELMPAQEEKQNTLWSYIAGIFYKKKEAYLKKNVLILQLYRHPYLLMIWAGLLWLPKWRQMKQLDYITRLLFHL